jgi:hypothetical protein
VGVCSATKENLPEEEVSFAAPPAVPKWKKAEQWVKPGSVIIKENQV